MLRSSGRKKKTRRKSPVPHQVSNKRQAQLDAMKEDGVTPGASPRRRKTGKKGMYRSG